ncbi:MAG: hypothetical protein O7H41_19130 [Planctomycetota bacterium]|nr:hypothetical protein [Planctomycetota bacterium]
MEKIRHQYSRLLQSTEVSERLRALDELEYLACEQDLTPELKVDLGRIVVDKYLGRGGRERLKTAQFLDVWFNAEPDASLSQRIHAIYLEEVDSSIRDSLLSAVYSTMPLSRILEELENPKTQAMQGGHSLLILVEALERRVKRRLVSGSDLDRVIRVLKRARAYRASLIARPFLWQIEIVLEGATLLREKLRHL